MDLQKEIYNAVKAETGYENVQKRSLVYQNVAIP